MKKPLSFPAAFLLIILLYLAGVGYATLFSDVPGKVVPVWPAAGVALAGFLLYGYRIWPAVLIGSILGQRYLDPAPLIFYPYSALAAVLSPALALWYLRRHQMTNLFAVSVRNGFLMLAAGMLASIVSAMIGTVGMIHDGRLNANMWAPTMLQWWLGDICSVMAFTPGVVSLVHRFSHEERRNTIMTFAHYSEKIIWLVSLLASYLVFHLIGDLQTPFAIATIFPPLALLLWSALRFPPVYTFGGVGLTALLVFYYFGLGHAGFPTPDTIWDFTLLLLLLTTMIMMPQVVAASTFERQCFSRELQWRANHDPLTGLPNREAFESRVNRILKNPIESENIALCYLDIDQFKVVNDTCGHAVGDHLVRQVATLLEEYLEKGDILARLGGDEFAVLLRHCTKAEARRRAERMRAVIDEHRFIWQKRIFDFSVSIGVVVADSDQTTFSRLLSEADTACYTAKELGRNRIKIRTENDLHLSRSHDHMEWAVRITEALEYNHFRLYCQPIAPVVDDGEDGLHFEVLLRMVDREGRLLMPGAFIPAAERFHLMTKVDQWVVENTLNWLATHPEQLEQVAICAINLSGASLGDSKFHEFLESILERANTPCHKLCFEITETAAIGDLNHAVRLIKNIKRKGCRFALDDFGSGLASFNYLKTLHVDYLKIDGVFVRDLEHVATDLAMVRSINEVGHLMNKKTIAEYVENEGIMQILIELGVDYAQGHSVGKPVPMDDFFAMTATRSPGSKEECPR